MTLALFFGAAAQYPVAASPYSSQNIVFGQSYNLTATGHFLDLDPTDTLTYSATNLPGGLSINSSTGAITGSPSGISVGDVFNVRVKATDQHGYFAEAPFTLTVVAGDPTYTPYGTTDVKPLDALSIATQFSSPNPAEVLSYSISGAPAWISVNSSTGALTGTAPAVASASYSFTITATSTYGTSATATVDVTVTAVAPTSSAIPNQSGNAPLSVSINLASYFATSNPSDTLTYSATGLPSGITRSGATISGTSIVFGTATVNVTATNNYGQTASRSFTISISDPTPVGYQFSTTTSSRLLLSPDDGSSVVSSSNGVGGQFLNAQSVEASGGTIQFQMVTGGNTFMTNSISVPGVVTGSRQWKVVSASGTNPSISVTLQRMS